jgi:NADPH2:quinone reductase
MVQGLTALHLVRRSPPKDKAVPVTAAARGGAVLLNHLVRRSNEYLRKIQSEGACGF